MAPKKPAKPAKKPPPPRRRPGKPPSKRPSAAAKPKPKPPATPSPPAPTINPDAEAALVELAILQIVNGKPIERFSADAAKTFPPSVVASAIDQARQRVVLAARVHTPEELGAAISRYRDLYATCIELKDARTALAVQKELTSLLRLKDPHRQEQAASATPTQADEDLQEIEAHLRPLNLAPPDYPLVETVRILAAKLCDLTAKPEAHVQP